MVNASNFYAFLAKRNEFNSSVRHILAINAIIDSCNPAKNIADATAEMITNKELDPAQLKAVFSVLLLDKWKYKIKSVNLRGILSDASAFIEEVSKWSGVDIVLGYEHPELGFLAINPKNPSSKSIIEGFRKNELLTIYAGLQDSGEISCALSNSVFEAVIKLLYGLKASVPPQVKTGKFKYTEPKKNVQVKQRKAAASKSTSGGFARQTAKKVVNSSVSSPAPAQQQVQSQTEPVATGRVRMSQLVSVVVSNELFHNGNVEAFKRIIRSYNARYPNAEVIIFYEGERIVDINTLFKWGKVKHGSSIQFSVAADEIKDLAKLSKYFREGASPRFESFLHGSPDTVLNLF